MACVGGSSGRPSARACRPRSSGSMRLSCVRSRFAISRLARARNAGHEVALRAATVVIDLNLRGWIFRKDASLLRSVRMDSLTGSIRIPAKPAAAATLDWRPWARLLPEKFQINELNLDVASSTTSVRLRGILLTASAIESGRFFAREIFVTAPLLRQTYRNLRGATSWEESRLTIAGIPLAQRSRPRGAHPRPLAPGETAGRDRSPARYLRRDDARQLPGPGR